MELISEDRSISHGLQTGGAAVNTMDMDMGERKLIIPSEVKVCATCSYWDGERRVDSEVGLVVVEDARMGECLVKELPRDCLNDVRHECDCLWEDLNPDDVEDLAPGGAANPNPLP